MKTEYEWHAPEETWICFRLTNFCICLLNFLEIEVWASFLYSFLYAKAFKRYKNLLALYKVHVQRIQIYIICSRL
jgi:hypothetical protein